MTAAKISFYPCIHEVYSMKIINRNGFSYLLMIMGKPPKPLCLLSLFENFDCFGWRSIVLSSLFLQCMYNENLLQSYKSYLQQVSIQNLMVQSIVGLKQLLVTTSRIAPWAEFRIGRKLLSSSEINFSPYHPLSLADSLSHRSPRMPRNDKRFFRWSLSKEINSTHSLLSRFAVCCNALDIISVPGKKKLNNARNQLFRGSAYNRCICKQFR